MKISVITVCYNEEKNIAKTISSVLDQTSNDFEYIICDGKSTDNTLNIAASFAAAFAEKGVHYRIVSQKDGGVYFGMNNGIDLAVGDYVIFINAGDSLHKDDVIASMIDSVKEDRPEVIYGDCMVLDRCAAGIVQADHRQLLSKMSICHPSILVRTDVLKENKFDTQYKMGADYNMFLSLYLKNCRFVKLDMVISTFRTGGISTVKIVDSVKELCRIKTAHNIPVDEAQEQSYAKKQQLLIDVKRKIPLWLWKLWSKYLKKKQWITE